MTHGMGRQRTPSGPAVWLRQRTISKNMSSAWPVCIGSHYNVQVCGVQIGEKEKKNSFSIRKRDGTREVRVERNIML